MTLSEFVLVTAKSHDEYCMRPQIVCVDGFAMSVQGSSGHYCRPRMSCTSYSLMEIGYPSGEEKELLEFAEESSSPTETVYGYVPVEIIQSVIDKHGGIDIEKTFKNNTQKA